MSTHFTRGNFVRQDESADENFYTTPRMVVHIFEQAGGYGRIEVERHVDEHATWYHRGHDPLFSVIGRRATNKE